MVKIINGTEFLQMVKGYRLCYVRGRFGSGKTLLACVIAAEFWKRNWVDHIYSNLNLKGDFEEKIPVIIEDAAVIFDEAWQQLDSRSFSSKVSQKWLAYLRKRGITIIFPSVITIDVRFRVLMCQRVLEVGNIYWFYRWIIDDGLSKFGGVFGLSKPLGIKDMYDHMEEPNPWKGEMIAETLGRGLKGGRDQDLVYDPDRDIGEMEVKKKSRGMIGSK